MSDEQNGSASADQATEQIEQATEVVTEAVTQAEERAEDALETAAEQVRQAEETADEIARAALMTEIQRNVDTAMQELAQCRSENQEIKSQLTELQSQLQELKTAPQVTTVVADEQATVEVETEAGQSQSIPQPSETSVTVEPSNQGNADGQREAEIVQPRPKVRRLL